MTTQVIADRLAWAAAVLAALCSVVGLVVPGLYRDTQFWAQQARGIDLATFLLATPILLTGLWAAGRGSRPGRLALAGGLLYLVYNEANYVTAVAMNPLAALHVAILGLAVWSLALAVLSIDLAASPSR